MKIVFCSAFRDALDSVHSYFQQMARLYFLLQSRGDQLYLLLGEGDSRDDTRAVLVEYLRQTGLAGALIDCTHGGRKYGHIIHRQRFAQLAGVYNKSVGVRPRRR